MITLEQIADLDRRGKREDAIMAAIVAEVAGRRAARFEWWPFGRRYHERAERRRDISRSLSLLLSTPETAQTEASPADGYCRYADYCRYAGSIL